MQVAEIQELIKEVVWFSVLSEEDLKVFTERLELRHYMLGETVYNAQDASDAFFLVYSGRVRVLGVSAQGEEITVGTLTRGQSFGELGLLTGAPRENSIRAADDVVLMRLSRTDFEFLLKSRPALREYFTRYDSEIAIRNFLKLSTVFRPLSPSDIQNLVTALERREYPAGTAIITEGEAGDAFYILQQGSAKVLKGQKDSQRVLGRIRPGTGFGELALFTGHPRAATIMAEEDCTVFRLDKTVFDEIVNKSPRVHEAFLAMMSGYGQEAEAFVHSLQSAEALAQQSEELPTAPLPPASVYNPRRARKYPALLQLSEMDCGAACLAMILRYYGKHVSINRLRELANISRDGASLYNVAEAAEQVGFQVRGIRANYDHLVKSELPAIAHWQGYHYIVVYEASPTHVLVADPAIGLRRISKADFERDWTGYLLLFTPTPRLEGVEESKTTVGRFLPLLKPYGRLLFEVFLASLALQLFGLASPIFTQIIVDRALVHKDVTLLNTMLMGMLIVTGFQLATLVLRQYLLVHTTRRIDLQMVVNFFSHLLHLPLRYFQDRKVGDILRRFTDNAKIRYLLTGRALGVMLDTIMVGVYVALMLLYSPRLTFISILFIPCYMLLTLAMTPLLQRQFRETFAKQAESESYIIETITGIGTVKSTATERLVRWKLEGLIVKGLNIEFRGAMLNVSVHAVATILRTLNSVLLFWYGAQMVIAGEMTVGQLVAFNVLVGMVTTPIISLIDLWHDIQDARLALERLNEVFEASPEEAAESRAIQIPPIRGSIRFENVTFRYPSRPDKNALQNIDLDIKPGQTVALVGRSGAGKTTFANLLLRLYEPNEGRVFIDGYDLKQVALSSLRSQIGVVPQEVFLFSGTIRENIAFGNPNAPLEQVVGAAMLAGAHEFISALPSGYESIIGERGQSLSGGQKQRIIIARALFRKPRILLFDEATSALDTESERAIQQNLDKILKDRTTFIIAHRLSTVRNADLIIVMDQGMIVEKGDHDTLMAQKGLYYYLNSQQLEQ